ncbi:MAG TPA: uroporphyrinogen-III C-methyltransferase [Pirellulales bacterium]|jgi:uroporphyrinogen III methyltransferase/synthase|nr:uroporphyrinogen-III C-methyltransferase [Pirellulales bacterium]
MVQPVNKHRGRVFLVGAGPGDPGLLTLRAAECLRTADLILYDYLVNPRILAQAAASAEQVCLGRHGHGRILSQAEINARMIAAANQGQQVVRLKSGDPLIFGRAGEELAALAAANIRVEIVPGITAAVAAGAYAGIPLTHRDLASAVALITGQESSDKDTAAIDFAALAKFPGTLVFYMGVTTAQHWAAALIAAGKSGDTPAVVLRRCSWADQTLFHSTLQEVAAEMAARHVRPPVLVIVGEVARQAPVCSWFVERPLFGQKILVTRAADQARSLIERLEMLGAECLIQPVIEIGPPADWRPVDAALERLDEFAWIVFSSANGVQSLLSRLFSQGRDARDLRGAQLAAIGPATATELAKFHLRADLQPAEFRAEALAAALQERVSGKKCLLIRASRGREVLREHLQAAGATIEQVVVYSSTDVLASAPEILSALENEEIGWITVTSSAIARSLVAMFGERLRKTKLASISPITSATLREFHHEPAVEATEYTMEGLITAICARTAPAH